jgi:hypothetical protein
MTDITYRIGVWCHNPDIVSVGNAAGSYLTTTEAVLNLDTFGGTTAPAGLLTGPGCFLSTNTDGTVIDGAGYRPGANSGSVSGVIDLSFVAAAGNTSILSKARQQVTIKQIVDGLDDATNAQNVTKTVARRNLFAGNTPYSNVDCLIVLDMAVVPGAGGPLLFTIEYVEGTVSNMVSIKTSPVYP